MDAQDPAAQVDPTPHPWQDLPPEHFQLLRLAPLPVHRQVGPRPLRYVQLGWVERHRKRESLLRMSVQLPGQLLHREINELDVWLDHEAREARLGPAGGLRVDPEERGLGRFLLARVASWLKTHAEGYRLQDMPLHIRDALDEERRARREQVLTTQGFTLLPEAEGSKTLVCHAERIAQLSEEWNTDKVQPLGLLEVAGLLQQGDRVLEEKEVKILRLEERLATFRRDDVCLRFAISCLAVFCLFQTALVVWLAWR